MTTWPPSTLPRLATLAPLALLLACSQGRADEVTFEKHVRPILKTHCFHCHGEGESLAGSLDLRLRRLIAAGGDSGAALVPGKPEESWLYQRMHDGEMPPEEVKIRPSAEEIETVRRWIAAGAATARPEPESLGEGLYLTEEERSYWAFQPVQRPSPPDVRQDDRVRTPIDRFLLARLEAEGLSFSEDADRRTLLRRAHFALIGLPPTPDETAAFLSDSSADAYERLVDRLLESSHYGERWGRHWLDLAGYADSEGYTDDDPERPDAYKYRDYVIRSLNADKPFDQFIREQLAGDEMVAPPFEDLSEQQIEQLTATGFLRMAPDGTGAGGVDQGQARNDCVADTLNIVSTALLGLTVGCAQCHHHRYDPISHEDYHRLRAIFEPAYDWKNWKAPKNRRLLLYSEADRQKAQQIEAEAKRIEADRAARQEEFIEQTFEKELAKLPEELREPIRQARSAPAKQRTPEQNKLLKENPSVNVTAGSLYLYDKKAADELAKLAEQAKEIRATKPKEEYLRALTEPAGKAPPATFVFLRGDFEQPGRQVKPAELAVLSGAEAAVIPEDDPDLPTTGRRLAYARWLTSGKHPLTARVIVNQVWSRHFGRGIVATPGDFGRLGAPPSHPELLDWLADEFVRSGWSLKRLHKLILASTAYRQSSQRRDAAEQVDGDNAWLSRAPVRRLEAEALRDSVLAVAGKLNARQFGPPVPVMADEVGQFVIGVENLNAGRPQGVIPLNGEELRRSVYIQVRRSRPLAVLDAFDLPVMTPNCAARSSSTVAPQSLMLMNSDFLAEQAGHFARRVQDESSEDAAAQVARAWLVALARAPTAEESQEAIAYLKAQGAFFASQPAKDVDPRHEALTSLCHVLLSSNEFLYID